MVPDTVRVISSIIELSRVSWGERSGDAYVAEDAEDIPARAARERERREIIVRGGSNIAPQEVEDVLLQHPAIFQAGVVGVPDPELGESVIAFVSLRDRGECCERELIDFARRFLSDHKVPGKVHFLASMPLGASGKVSRKSLKESLAVAAAG